MRHLACGGLINRLGVGPSIVNLALLRAGKSPLLDLSADWAAAEAAQILDDPSSEDDPSSSEGAAAGGPSAFGPRPQLVRGGWGAFAFVPRRLSTLRTGSITNNIRNRFVIT